MEFIKGSKVTFSTNCAFPLRTSNFRELTKVNKILCTTQSFLRFFFYHSYPNPKMLQKVEILDSTFITIYKKILSQRGYTANNKHNQSTLTANTDSLDFYESCSSYQRCTISKPVIKKFAIFTEKQLCWSLFSSKVAIL